MSDHESRMSLGFALEEVPVGTHVCYIYNDDDERKHVVTKFLESGILNRELILYVADKPTPQDVVNHLRELGVDLSKMSRENQLFTVPSREVYVSSGTFFPDDTLNAFQAFLESINARGFAMSRGSSEMTWALEGYPGSERLAEYEGKSTYSSKNSRMPVSASMMPVGLMALLYLKY